MAKKTVFRRMSKWLPLSPEVLESAEKETDTFRNAHATASPAPYSIEDDGTDILPPEAASEATEAVLVEIEPVEKAAEGDLI